MMTIQQTTQNQVPATTRQASLSQAPSQSRDHAAVETLSQVMVQMPAKALFQARRGLVTMDIPAKKDHSKAPELMNQTTLFLGRLDLLVHMAPLDLLVPLDQRDLMILLDQRDPMVLLGQLVHTVPLDHMVLQAHLDHTDLALLPTALLTLVHMHQAHTLVHSATALPHLPVALSLYVVPPSSLFCSKCYVSFNHRRHRRVDALIGTQGDDAKMY